MTIVRQNSFDSIWAAGTELTPQSSGNTGGPAGDSFNALFASSVNSIQFHSALKMHGTQCARISAAGGTSATFGYDDAAGTYDTLYTRGYFRFTAFHSAVLFLQHARSSASGSTGYSIRVDSDGYVQMYQRSGAQVLGQTLNPLAINTWYRIEAKFGRNGEWALRVHSGDSYSPHSPEIAGSGATTDMTTGMQFIRWGIEASAGMTLTAYVDDVAYADDWIGPTPTASASVVSVAANDGWAVIGTSSEVNALGDTSDGTYMRSPVTTATHHPVRYRVGALGDGDVEVVLRLAGDSSPSVRVRLYQGSTLLKTWTQVVTATPTDYTFKLSIAENELIVQRANVLVEVSGVS